MPKSFINEIKLVAYRLPAFTYLHNKIFSTKNLKKLHADDHVMWETTYEEWACMNTLLLLSNKTYNQVNLTRLMYA